MRSTDAANGWRSQRGVSIIEVLVASALLGIGVVTGLTAWNTATLGADRAIRQAWAQCIVRSELDAVLAMQWSDRNGYAPPPVEDARVHVSVTAPAVSGRTDEQRVTVLAIEGPSGAVIARASAFKLRALAGTKSQSDLGTDVFAGCPSP